MTSLLSTIHHSQRAEVATGKGEWYGDGEVNPIVLDVYRQNATRNLIIAEQVQRYENDS